MFEWTERPDLDGEWTGRKMHELRRTGSNKVIASLRQHSTGKRRWYVWTGAPGCMFAQWDGDDIATARADVELDMRDADTRYNDLKGRYRR